MPKPVKLWSVVRIVDYRIQALACEADPVWEDISGDTIITQDRQRMYDLARECRGLLVSSEGVPSARQIEKYRVAAGAEFARLVALQGDEATEPASKPAIERGDADELGLPAGDFDPHKAASRSAAEVG